jgi:hypothetical protein
VIDYVMARDGSKLLDALKTLGWRGQAGGVIRRRRRSPPRLRPAQPPPRTDKPAWHDPAWQAALNAIIEEAEAHLWSPDGRDALEWLRNRGLEDHTLSRFRVGFLDRPIRTRPLDVLGLDKHGRKRGLWLPRGVVLPWGAPGAWYSAHQDPDEPAPEARWCGLNVRRLHDDASQPWNKDIDGPKLMAAAGSERGHTYPWPDLCAGVPALICEGEFDALLAFQEVGHLVNVVSVGSASQTPSRDALLALACCPRWIVVLDADEAGRMGAWKWFKIGPNKVQTIKLEEGSDLTDYHLTGRSVARLIAQVGSV